MTSLWFCLCELFVESLLDDKFKKIHAIVSPCKGHTRKESAFYFMSCENSAVLFLMLNNKSYDNEIWKRIRPTFEKPFMNNEEV